MADEELHYLTYDPDSIWDSMLDVYMAQGGDILYGGDEKEMLLRSVQEVIVLALGNIDNALRMTTLRYAQGDYLKLIGEERGCEYMDALPASATLRITFKQGYAAQTIAAGATFTADGATMYTTDADIDYTGQAQTIDVGITCTEAGSRGNGVPAGTVMRSTEGLAMIESARTIDATSGGRDAEDYEDYRERVRQAIFMSVTTGPVEQYRARTMAATTQLHDATVLQGDPGVVEVYLLIKDGATPADVISTVKEALNAETVRPLTDTVNVQEALVLSYNIDAEYKLPEGALTTSAQKMQDAADEYQQWQDTEIGRAFDPYQLVANLYRAGAERVKLLDTSKVGGNALDYTAVDKKTRCKGIVNLTMAEDE